MHHILTLFALVLALFGSQILAMPYLGSRDGVLQSLSRRTDPVFPDQPASCPICAQNYPSINSCAAAAPVLANVSTVIFNPGAFIDVIKCACTDTFQSAFPQCVDCFQQTNQTDVLNITNLPSILSGIKEICALESTLLGNVTDTNNASASQSAAGSQTTSMAFPAVDVVRGGAFATLLLALSVLQLLV